MSTALLSQQSGMGAIPVLVSGRAQPRLGELGMPPLGQGLSPLHCEHPSSVALRDRGR